ncbi:mannan endo-1,4-beta-mannosidase 5-like [Zingiber officinale]|uniref:mannan endo-1,4-beta-mannosidase 5-like n=1 Tax=Zingiber officinale TaxID=94328 RepID=UPI001C4D2717|nr:mannan endo-1,4-beta-mannosidase 5-like [Zingiber officinale]
MAKGSQLFLCVLALVAATTAAADLPGFIERYGRTFWTEGSEFLFNGFNAYWLMGDAASPYSNGSKVTALFEEAAAAGLTVCRTWAFYDGYSNDSLQVTPGVYHEQVFKGLDFVIAEARKKGIRLILSLVNNYKDYGGRPQYVDWARRAGLAVPSDDDFYTHDVIKGYFKEHIEYILNRTNTFTNITYKNDPTIMAWELMNEPHCESDPSGKIVTAWVQEMATFLKSIDRKHLLGVGLEGFYGSSTPDKVKLYNPNAVQIGVDFIEVHKVNEIDYATVHAYPDFWLKGQSEVNKTEFVKQWLWNHWKDSMEVLGKPFMLGEFGKTKKDPGYSEQIRNDFYSTVYDSIYSISKDGHKTFTGGLLWQLFVKGMESYYDGFEIILSQDASATALILNQSKKMGELAGAA